MKPRSKKQGGGDLLIVLGLLWLLNGGAGFPLPLPSSSPLNVDRLTVVVIREAYDSLSGDQKIVVDSTPFVAADLGADFAVVDPDQDVSKGRPWEAEALARPRQSLPWLIVANGRGGSEGPLPQSIDAFRAAVAPYQLAL